MLTSREHAHCVRSGPARGPACAPAEALLALRRPTPRPGSTCTSLAARRALSSSWRSCPSWRAGWHSRARSPGTAPPPSAPFWRGRPSVGTSWALGCQSTAGAYNSMVKARSVHIFLAEVRQGRAHFAVSRFAMLVQTLALCCLLWPPARRLQRDDDPSESEIRVVRPRVDRRAPLFSHQRRPESPTACHSQLHGR